MPPFLTELDRAALEAEGIQGWAYGVADRVRFYELDALNHVNNTAYLRWFETIRVAYVQAYGMSSYGPDDPQLVVRHVSADYLAPMFQDEDYIVTARTKLLKPSSFVMDYAVYVGGAIKATGVAVGVSLEADGQTRRAHKPGAIDYIVERDGAELRD